jgi:AcrR family transcriptional regulator
MARRPKRTSKRRKASTAESTDPKVRLVEAALALAAEQSWAKIAYADIARRARVPMADALALLPTKTAILAEFQRRLDRAMLQAGESADGSARDRLFEILMRRFDALAPRREALRSIARSAPLDPAAAVCGWLQLVHSMRLALSVTGCPAEGIPGLIAAKGLAGLYLSVLPVFLADASADHAATMAALDRRLRCIETLSDCLRARAPKTV